MWHHAEHVATLVHDARDVARRAVGVLARLAVGIDVAEDDAVLGVEFVQRGVVGGVVAVAVGDWDLEPLADGEALRERRRRGLDAQRRRPADEA